MKKRETIKSAKEKVRATKRKMMKERTKRKMMK